MNKKVFGRKLSRSRPTREALFASLATALIKNGKIETTRAKAKAVVPSVEKLVTLAKKADITSRRRALANLDNSRSTTDILFLNVAKAFLSRQSGFTRIISLPRRVGDNAEMVRLEWTEKVEFEAKKKEEKSPKNAAKKSEKEVTKKEVKSKK
jgi:large subunit ribosomal protein L17